MAYIPPSLRLPIFQDPCSPGPFFPRFLFPKNPKTLKNPREKAVFQISLGPLGPGTLYFPVFFLFFIFCCFSFSWNHPIRLPRTLRFLASLGPGSPLRKSPGTQKWRKRGLFYAFWKTQECIAKNKVSGHFCTSKTSGPAPPPPVESVFQKLLKRRTTCKNAGIMAFFWSWKRNFFSKNLFFLQLALFICFVFFLETPYQAATKHAFLGEQARVKIDPRRFKRVFCLTCFAKCQQLEFSSFSWPHFCLKSPENPVKMQVKCSSTPKNTVKYRVSALFWSSWALGPQPHLTPAHHLLTPLSFETCFCASSSRPPPLSPLLFLFCAQPWMQLHLFEGGKLDIKIVML